MICSNCKTAITTRRYVYGQGSVRGIAPLCDTCAEGLAAIGMDLRSGDRPADPVDNRPEWLRRLQPKVMDHGTGGVA